MYTYTLTQWLLFFFIYCFFGWVWESCFVSVRKKQWINRGFLHGPVIPIYGFGAIVILLSTLRVRENLLLVYLLGMLGATALEYFTGASMEALFHVRYWDYSDKPLNLGGHICLRVSLGWGVFSVLLVRFLHPPVESLVLRVPEAAGEPAVLVFLAAFAVDMTLSVREALDLREMLDNLAESSAAVAYIQSRLSQAADALAENSQELREKVVAAGEQLREEAQLRETQLLRSGRSRRAALDAALAREREKHAALFDSLSSRADEASAALRSARESADAAAGAAKARLLDELISCKDRLLEARQHLAAWHDRDYRRAASLLRRNPSARSSRHADALEQLRALGGDRKRH